MIGTICVAFVVGTWFGFAVAALMMAAGEEGR